MTIEQFGELIHSETKERICKDFPGLDAEWESRVKIAHGKKYARVDVGSSGKYMVDYSGNIYGIKAYGVPNLKKQFGTLETVDGYYWGGYWAVPLNWRSKNA